MNNILPILIILYSLHEVLKDSIQFNRTIFPNRRFWNIEKAGRWYSSLKSIPRFLVRPFFDAYHLSMTICWQVIFYLIRPDKDFTALQWQILCILLYPIIFELSRAIFQGKFKWNSIKYLFKNINYVVKNSKFSKKYS